MKIFGWWKFLAFFGLDSYEEIINYDQIIKVSVNNTNINIEFEKLSQTKIIHLKASSFTDAALINDSISKHITENRRKLEIEKSLRIKYKSGDFNTITPHDFEKVIGELFSYMGYSVTHVGGSGDGGIDLKCLNYSTGEKVIVQCKRYSGKVGIGSIRDFYGALIHSRADKGYIFTTSEFTKETKIWVHDKPIELVDSYKLSQLMMQYYK